MKGLHLKGVSKRFGNNMVLRGVDLDVPPATAMGLIATNGAGKTTLVNVVFGVHPADEGVIRFDGRRLPKSPAQVVRHGLARTFQNVRLPRDMSVREVVQAVVLCRRAGFVRGFLTPSSVEVEQRVAELLDIFGLAAVAAELAGNLPFGVQRRVDIARALATEPRLMFLDEPAAGLTQTEAADLSATLESLVASTGIALVVIDHRLDFLCRFVRRLVFLDGGAVALDSVGSDLDSFLSDERVEQVYGAARLRAEPRAKTGSNSASPIGVRCDGVSVYRESTPAVREATFQARATEWTAIIGPNGAGKSSLLEGLAGVVPCSGVVTIRGQRITGAELGTSRDIGFVPESREIVPHLSVRDNLRLGCTHSPEAWRELINGATSRFPFLLDVMDRPASLLSGGQQQMLAVARALCSDPAILLLDEPTAGLAPNAALDLDVTFRRMADRGKVVLSCGQDHRSAQAHADRVYEMRDGKVRPAVLEAPPINILPLP